MQRVRDRLPPGGRKPGTARHPAVRGLPRPAVPATGPIPAGGWNEGSLAAWRDALEDEGRRERMRLAGRIHDGVLQSVTAAVIELESMERRHEDCAASGEIRLTADGLREALRELRRTLADLTGHPAGRSTGATLERAVRGIVLRWRLPVRVRVEGDLRRVPQDLVAVAEAVVGEGLANAAKHALTPTVAVDVIAGDDELLISVADRGRGFSPADEVAAREEHHIGLMMLRRRVKEAGGRLRIDSQPGKGTTIVARLPLREGTTS